MANLWNKKYSRERKRVTSMLRELRKAGYRFTDDVIPQVLSRKGRTQESLKAATLELRKITRSKLYRESTGRVTTSGEILPVKRTAKERRKQAIEIRKGGDEPLYETTTVIERATDTYIKMSEPEPEPEPDYTNLNQVEYELTHVDYGDYKSIHQYNYHKSYADTMYSLLQEIISDEGFGDEEEGRKIVARRLQERSSEINEIIYTILKESGTKGTEHSEQDKALARFAEIIKGGVLSPHENERITDIAELIAGV